MFDEEFHNFCHWLVLLLVPFKIKQDIQMEMIITAEERLVGSSSYTIQILAAGRRFTIFKPHFTYLPQSLRRNIAETYNSLY